MIYPVGKEAVLIFLIRNNIVCRGKEAYIFSGKRSALFAAKEQTFDFKRADFCRQKIYLLRGGLRSFHSHPADMPCKSN